MTRSLRAELARLLRRRVLVSAALAVLIIGIGAAAIVLNSATPAADVQGGGFARPTLESLTSAGGGTEIFRWAASFFGTLVFVVFVGLFSLEYARGTYRTMLLRQPQRIHLLAGKMAGLLAFVAAMLAAVEVVTWVAAKVLAPVWNVSTSAWTNANVFGSAIGDFATVLLWAAGYATLGMFVAMMLRSVPLAIGVGIAWAGPFEHLMQDTFPSLQRVFPGLSLEVLGQGGTPKTTFMHALVMVIGYLVAAAVSTGAVFRRRDMTAA
jgi:ABC-type transport system involved in multi-copper enzyme maturation permease subunit